MLVTATGQLIRFRVKDVRIAGRNTKGVTLFKTEAGEKIASVARIEESEDAAQGNGRGNGSGEGNGHGGNGAHAAQPGLGEVNGGEDDVAETVEEDEDGEDKGPGEGGANA